MSIVFGIAVALALIGFWSFLMACLALVALKHGQFRPLLWRIVWERLK